MGRRNPGLNVVNFGKISDGLSLLSVEDEVTLLLTSMLVLVDSFDENFGGFWVTGADILGGTKVVRLRISGRVLLRLILKMEGEKRSVVENPASVDDGSSVGGCLIRVGWVGSVVVVEDVASPLSELPAGFLIHGKPLLVLIGVRLGMNGFLVVTSPLLTLLSIVTVTLTDELVLLFVPVDSVEVVEEVEVSRVRNGGGRLLSPGKLLLFPLTVDVVVIRV